jgi:hypothetical protein
MRLLQHRYRRDLVRFGVVVTCSALAWSIWALSDWLRDAYDVQKWFRARHLELVNTAAELIALVGAIPIVAFGMVVGLFVAFLFPLPNPALQATAASPRS